MWKLFYFYAGLFLWISPLLLEAAQCPNSTYCSVLENRATDCMLHELASTESKTSFLITPKNESYSLMSCSPSKTIRPTHYFRFTPTRTGVYEITATTSTFDYDTTLLFELRKCNDQFYGCNDNQDSSLIPYVHRTLYGGAVYVAYIQRLGSENYYRNDTFRLNFLKTDEFVTNPPRLPSSSPTRFPTIAPTRRYYSGSQSMQKAGLTLAILLGIIFGAIWLFIVVGMICFVKELLACCFCRRLARETEALRVEKRRNEERGREAERNLQRQREEEEANNNNNKAILVDDTEMGIPVARVVPKASVVKNEVEDDLDKFVEARPHTSTPSATVTGRATGPILSISEILNRSRGNTSYVGNTPSTARRSYFTRYHGNEDLVEEVNGNSIDALPEASMTPQ